MFDIADQDTTQFDLEYYAKLADHGLYLDAQVYCLAQWGPMASWQRPDQIKIAIRLLSNLGRDRDADALILRSWRRCKNDADLCLKVVFYQLNRFGPIRAQRFYQQHLPLLQELNNADTDLALVQICFYADQKDFVAANELLELIRPQAKDYPWFHRIELMLLQEQQLYPNAAELAQQLLPLYPSDHMLLACCRALLSAQRGDEARVLLQQHATKYQSCRVWAELIRLSSRSMNWQLCATAVRQFQQLQPLPDRNDADLLAVCQAKIALSQGDYQSAQQLLRDSYCSYNRILHDNLTAYQPVEQPFKLLSVPHVRQHHLTCAPATLAALSAYFGQHFCQHDIAAEICFDGTPDTLERQWLRQKGYAFIELELNAEICYQLIDADLPFALVTTYGMSSHIQAVVGYNKALGTAYLMDPSYDTITEILLAKTLTDEAASGPRAMVFAPQAQQDKLTRFANTSTVLYQLYDQFETSRKANALTEATQYLAKMQQYDAQHRLTLIARRSLAIDHNDELLINTVNEQLLQRFPKHVGWRLSRFQTLKNIGQGDDAIAYLMQQVANQPHIDLKVRLFSEIYRLQPYQQYCQTLLRDLEISGSYRADVYALLADYYWQQQQHAKSCQYYFVACCLDDTHQDYVESFFKAARFLNQTESAMQRLNQRFEKYGARAASPAISLYRAYDWQGKAQQGLQVLQLAWQKRPTDVELLDFYLDQLLHHGQINDFIELLQQQRSLLSEQQFHYWQARQAEWHGELLQAANSYRHSFELTPWVSRVAEPYFSALRRSNNNEQLALELDQLKKEHPAHPLLNRYLADWHPVAEIASEALAQLATLFPHNAWYQRRWIQQLLQQQELDQAQQHCTALLHRLPQQADNLMLLARVLQAQQQPDAAKVQIKQVLQQQIDHEDAVQLLFELSPSLTDKQQSLQWLLELMPRQTHYGDALLDVVHFAERLFTAEQTQQFIQQVLQKNTHVWSTRLAWAKLLQQHSYDAALEQLQLAIADFPLLPRLHLELAELYRKMQRTEQAKASYQHAISLNPAWSFASRQYALFLEQMGEISTEIAVISETLKHKPDDAYLHGFLADAYDRDQQTDKAIHHLQLAVRFDHTYQWAWSRLHELATNSGQIGLALELALNLHQQAPLSVGAIKALAQITSEPAAKCAYWLQAIQLSPTDSQLHLDVLDFHLQRGNYAELFAHIEHYFNATNRPFEVSALAARAWERIGQPEKSIELLTEALAVYTPQLHYWQQLIDLQQQLNNNAAAAKTAQQLMQRLPNDAMAQCIAAEYLLDIDHKKYQQQADTAIERAQQLDPTSQYIGLTQADRLLHHRKYEQCIALIERLHQHNRDIWTISRQLKALLRQDCVAPALLLWQEIINSKEENFWLYNNTLQYADKHANLLLDELTNNLEQAANLAGYTLAKWLASSQPKKLKQLLQGIVACRAWDGMYEYYLEQCEANNELPQTTLLDPYSDRITANVELVGRLGFLYRNHTRLYQAVRLYASIDAEQRPCYVSYHYAITLIELRRWPEALEVLQQGATSTPDGCFHNLQLWLLASSYCQQPTDISTIRFINRQQLTATEQIVWLLFDLLYEQQQTPLPPQQLLQRLAQIRRSCRSNDTDDKIHRVGRHCFSQLHQLTADYGWTIRLRLKLLSFWLF